LLKLFRGSRLLLEITMPFIPAYEARRYSRWSSASNAEAVLDIERTGDVFQVTLLLRHDRYGSREFRASSKRLEHPQARRL
jgi:hypothetical protein